MGLGEAVALAIVIVLGAVALRVGADLYRRRLELLERQLDLMAQASAEKSAHYAALTESLDHRVRLLEQIATERQVERARPAEDRTARPENPREPGQGGYGR